MLDLDGSGVIIHPTVVLAQDGRRSQFEAPRGRRTHPGVRPPTEEDRPKLDRENELPPGNSRRWGRAEVDRGVAVVAWSISYWHADEYLTDRRRAGRGHQRDRRSAGDVLRRSVLWPRRLACGSACRLRDSGAGPYAPSSATPRRLP